MDVQGQCGMNVRGCHTNPIQVIREASLILSISKRVQMFQVSSGTSEQCFPTYRTEQQTVPERRQGILCNGPYHEDDVSVNAQIDTCQSQKSVVKNAIDGIINMRGALRKFGHLAFVRAAHLRQARAYSIRATRYFVRAPMYHQG